MGINIHISIFQDQIIILKSKKNMKLPNATSFNENLIFCFKNKRPWLNTSLYDILIKYRRTKLGPLWLLLSTLFTIIILCFVWSKLLKIEFLEYFSYVFSGFAVWILITNFINDSLTLLSEKYNLFMQNIPGSLMVYIFRHVSYGFLNFLHLFPVIIIIMIINFEGNFLSIFYFFFGLILILIIAILYTTILSILSSRFRDLVPLIQSLFGASLILTPVIWKKEMLGGSENYVYLNPLSAYVEVVRDPILSNTPHFFSYLVCFVTIIFLYFIIYLLFRFKGNRFIFWI
jgi:ABC-type polysaccharide/polyol phosphate export permease